MCAASAFTVAAPPGFTPGSLFSIRPLRHPDGTETVSNYTILFFILYPFPRKVNCHFSYAGRTGLEAGPVCSFSAAGTLSRCELILHRQETLPVCGRPAKSPAEPCAPGANSVKSHVPWNMGEGTGGSAVSRVLCVAGGENPHATAFPILYRKSFRLFPTWHVLRQETLPEYGCYANGALHTLQLIPAEPPGAAQPAPPVPGSRRPEAPGYDRPRR